MSFAVRANTNSKNRFMVALPNTETIIYDPLLLVRRKLGRVLATNIETLLSHGAGENSAIEMISPFFLRNKD